PLADDADAIVARVPLDEPLPVDVPALHAVVSAGDTRTERLLDLELGIAPTLEHADVRARRALRRLAHEPHAARPRDGRREPHCLIAVRHVPCRWHPPREHW